MDRISIVTTVFNAVNTIRESIESIHNQKIPVEHIVIDGGSTDGTLEIIEKYKSRIPKVISGPDEGIYHGINKGLSLVRGDVVGLLHADDLYAGPEVLSKVRDVFFDKKVDSCYGDLVYVDSKNTERITRYWHAGKYKKKAFYWGWMPPHPTFFVRRSVYEKYGFFNTDLGSSADYELMLRFLLKCNISTRYIPEVMVKMRIGGISNASIKNRLIANRMDKLAWRVNSLKPYPFTLILKPMTKLRQFIFTGR